MLDVIYEGLTFAKQDFVSIAQQYCDCFVSILFNMTRLLSDSKYISNQYSRPQVVFEEPTFIFNLTQNGFLFPWLYQSPQSPAQLLTIFELVQLFCMSDVTFLALIWIHDLSSLVIKIITITAHNICVTGVDLRELLMIPHNIDLSHNNSPQLDNDSPQFFYSQ